MAIADSYQTSTAWLFEQFPSYQLIGSKAYKPTLNNITELLLQLGNPQKELSFVHIAGSNGKGSVSAFIASVAKESGYKTGLFTSPHIKDFRERIRINGESISEEEVIEFVKRIRKMDLSFAPSFFEVTFAMALVHFKRNGCELCVIETGMGGRLDATNIIVPQISIITTISLEHQNILGNTLEEIAKEKGGIIKQGVPVVVGEISAGPLEVLYEMAIKCHSPFYKSDQVEIPSDINDLPILSVNYQKENLQTAMTAMKILNTMGWELKTRRMSDALKNIRENAGFFGRMEVISTSPLLIYDVSHNIAGLSATFDAISSKFSGELHVIFGTSNDKDISGIKDLFPLNSFVYLTEFSNSRSASIEKLRMEFNENNFPSTTYWKSPLKALEAAKKQAKLEDCILITGSFFLVSELY